MKQIKIENRIKLDKALFAEVQRVNLLLEEDIGSSTPEISAEWKFVSLRGEEMLELTISDQINETSIPFSRAGLAPMSVDGFRILLIRLWGDLLQERANRQMERLMTHLHALQES